MLAFFAVQATGKREIACHRQATHDQRLAFAPLVACASNRLNGNAAAIAPCRSCRRPRRLMRSREESLAGWPVWYKVRRSVAHECIVFDYERARHRTYNPGHMSFISAAEADKNSYDVIVVGSGAAGGQTAYTLTMDGAAC
jgi:choline dehydrogenase-like flavoprotein